MSIYSSENISKIVKLSPREFPHLQFKIAKISVCENYGVYSRYYMIKDLQSSLASLWHGVQHFSDDSPNSFPCAVLLNANRAGSMGKRTWCGVQGRSEATIQMFKLCTCRLDPLNPHSVIQHNEIKSGIGHELLVSVLQTHLLQIYVSLFFFIQPDLPAFKWNTQSKGIMFHNNLQVSAYILYFKRNTNSCILKLVGYSNAFGLGGGGHGYEYA